MAEGWARQLFPKNIEIFSAGTKPGSVNPYAVAVMQEVGVDLSHAESKSIDRFLNDSFELVVTVCDSAKESCPLFPGVARTIHAPFDDPPTLTANEPDAEKRLTVYRRVRDEIRNFIETLTKDTLSERSQH